MASIPCGKVYRHVGIVERAGLCGHIPLACRKGRSTGILTPCHFLSQSYWGYMLASMSFLTLVVCGAVQACWSHDISNTGHMEECLGTLALINFHAWPSMQGIQLCWLPHYFPVHLYEERYEHVSPHAIPKPSYMRRATGMLVPMAFQSPVLWVRCLHMGFHGISHPGRMMVFCTY